MKTAQQSTVWKTTQQQPMWRTTAYCVEVMKAQQSKTAQQQPTVWSVMKTAQQQRTAQQQPTVWKTAQQPRV